MKFPSSVKVVQSIYIFYTAPLACRRQEKTTYNTFRLCTPLDSCRLLSRSSAWSSRSYLPSHTHENEAKKMDEEEKMLKNLASC